MENREKFDPVFKSVCQRSRFSRIFNPGSKWNDEMFNALVAAVFRTIENSYNAAKPGYLKLIDITDQSEAESIYIEIEVNLHPHYNIFGSNGQNDAIRYTTQKIKALVYKKRQAYLDQKDLDSSENPNLTGYTDPYERFFE